MSFIIFEDNLSNILYISVASIWRFVTDLSLEGSPLNDEKLSF